MTFDDQPRLQGDTLALRPLRNEDLGGVLNAASDPAIWAGHPVKDRYKPEVFRPYFEFLLQAGGTLVIIDRTTDQIIGCSRYYTAPDRPGTMAIGFTFLATEWWGGPANFEVKTLMLGHAFEDYPEVWFHIDPSNIRSQRATAKLGAEHVYDATLDLGGTPTPWKCYRLSRAAWQPGGPKRKTH